MKTFKNFMKKYEKQIASYQSPQYIHFNNVTISAH